MARPYRLVVFDALMLRGLAINDNQLFPDELAAFRVVFRQTRLRILITEGIRAQYETEATKEPQFQLLPALNRLSESRVAVQIDENRLRRSAIRLVGFPKWHQTFIRDTIAANAEYLVATPTRRRWLNLSAQTETTYGLQIVTPARFVELED